METKQEPSRLRRAILRAMINGKFHSTEFFQDWFAEGGEPYYVLFRKNLRVTNVQHVELISLLTRLTRSRTTGQYSQPQFSSASQFRAHVEGLATAVQGSDTSSEWADRLESLYGEILHNHIVVEPLFGSCIIYLPPTLTIDPMKLCAEAGYIHSLGRLVWARNAQEAEYSALDNALRKHLTKTPPQRGKRLPFIIYSHEDFSKHDRSLSAELKFGLDDTKIYVSKFYIGELPLAELPQAIGKKYKQELFVPPAGPSQQIVDTLWATDDIDHERTIWLVADRSIGDKEASAGDIVFLACYDQIWTNQTPYYFFDEDKPAWYDHVTMPHTLAAGLLNIALVNLSKPVGTQLKLLDPFAGSGTTLFESSRFDVIDASGCDLEPIAARVFKDNHEFFDTNLQGLEQILSQLINAVKAKSAPTYSPRSTSKRRKKKAIETEVERVEKLFQRCLGRGFALKIEQSVADELGTLPLWSRLLFYIRLRAFRRRKSELQREATEWSDAVQVEWADLRQKIERFIRLKKRMPKHHETLGNSISFEGEYSRATSVNLSAQKSTFLRPIDLARMEVADCTKWLPKMNFADIILTDPPYGFNTVERPHELAELYKASIDEMVKALNAGGCLVICLPEKSYTGRRLPAYTSRAVIVQQVIAAATRHGKKIIQRAQSMPTPNWVFRGELYWQSEKALRRTVLFFEFR